MPLPIRATFVSMPPLFVDTASNTNLDHAHNVSSEISFDGSWITQNGDDVLWVPQEYRVGMLTVRNNKIAVGTTSGKVWICTIGY